MKVQLKVQEKNKEQLFPIKKMTLNAKLNQKICLKIHNWLDY